jgi:hypothetical protein
VKSADCGAGLKSGTGTKPVVAGIDLGVIHLVFNLGLSDQEELDLVENLKSL